MDSRSLLITAAVVALLVLFLVLVFPVGCSTRVSGMGDGGLQAGWSWNPPDAMRA